MGNLSVFILGLFCFCGLATGFFLFLRPNLAIKLQIKFYEKINWKIQPVSMQKEIRNTRMMGLFLIILSLACGVYFILRQS